MSRNMQSIFGRNGSETPEPVEAEVKGETPPTPSFKSILSYYYSYIYIKLFHCFHSVISLLDFNATLHE